MKNVIRAFVFALTITGTAAYTTTSSSTVTVASDDSETTSFSTGSVP